ncbi:lipopolysaccharide assembly protein LapA domain-containing protein [Methylobacterium organophilum]|uniref:Lipopolysaccharide assembly protein A domain-containing protein n=1 Tax=Methylobacterium organophilum TaxID=410 RepID=A0ABQ4T826_METOR|nr:lipopolysaccharide assembly protein LapA domain-containing protein [Methylobacterium organophilum]UMY19745.1 lipopolysaccharide assembly protein LapA domain-containing protein [Methylobacterium organophilum]GJE26365.1 hypothetical protein LKMONMHP_1216 [Methylobacterium organophilum]
MIRFLKSLILLPIAIVVVLLAVANRQIVTISADPFSPEPVFALAVPLYAVLFAAVALGILVGGIGSWFGQGTTRRRARYHRREADRLEREAAHLRNVAAVNGQTGENLRVPNRVALPAPR